MEQVWWHLAPARASIPWMCDHYPSPLGSCEGVSVDQTELLREMKLQSLCHPLAGTLFAWSSWVLAITRKKIVHSKLSAHK